MPTDGNLRRASEKMVKISYSCCGSKVSQLGEMRSLSVVSLLLKILLLEFQLYISKVFFPFTKV